MNYFMYSNSIPKSLINLNDKIVKMKQRRLVGCTKDVHKMYFQSF